MPSFSGKVVLVTGGTRGIGLGCVRAFVEAGGAVAFCGRSQRSVDEAMDQLVMKPGRLLGVVADVRRKEDVYAAVEAVRVNLGGLDVLINSAGIGSGTRLPDITVDEWDTVLDTNLRGTFLACQACYPLMSEGQGGAIVNVASVAGQTGGLAAGVHYAASKAGILGLTKSLAVQLAEDNIRVNCVAPADIDTEMTSLWPRSLRKTLISRTPLRRFGSVWEVVRAILFVASEESGFITGETMNVNGGLFMP